MGGMGWMWMWMCSHMPRTRTLILGLSFAFGLGSAAAMPVVPLVGSRPVVVIGPALAAPPGTAAAQNTPVPSPGLTPVAQSAK